MKLIVGFVYGIYYLGCSYMTLVKHFENVVKIEAGRLPANFEEGFWFGWPFFVFVFGLLFVYLLKVVPWELGGKGDYVVGGNSRDWEA